MHAVPSAADRGKDIGEALAGAAGAAEKGAASTKHLQVTFGRAKNLGERSTGHVDPGAKSMSYLSIEMKEGCSNG